MPWSGGSNQTFSRTDGVRTGATTWQQAQAASVPILSSAADVHDQDIASGINDCLKKDGGNHPTANLPMGGYKHTGVADASVSTEYASKGQMDTALALKAALSSPTLTGTPAAPTAAGGTNTTQIATTAFVTSAISAATQIPSGSTMLFRQTAAPTGWTKLTDSSWNDKMLRIVTGTVGVGGSTAMSTAWSSVALTGSVGSHTLTAAEMPSHTHTGTTGTGSASHQHSTFDWDGSYVAVNGGSSVICPTATNPPGSGLTGAAGAAHTHSFTSNSSGSDGGHNHTLSINSFTASPAYIDFIAATKN
jgi:hypothetical protein